MSPTKKKTSSKSARQDVQDINEISGEVAGGAVIVQGDDARVDIRQQEATPSEIRKQAEMADLILLKHTVSVKLENLNKLLASSIDKNRNPYGFGQALKFKESDLLVGREQVLLNLVDILKTDHTAFVTGNGGIGRTSLLQAGLMPQIVRQGDMPVLCSVSPGSLEVKIMREFLGEVSQTLYLSQVPLSTFLRHVAESLPPSRHIHILIDQFEDFLSRPEAEKETFKQEWIHCMSNIPRVHWTFSVHIGSSHLLNYFRPEINPFSDQVVLSPLDHDSARQFITKSTSMFGFKVEEPVTEDILIKLGGRNIDPGQLQTVCYLLAGGSGPIRMNWTMADYEKSGYANGILSQSLEWLIGQLKHGDRESAWRILAFLAEAENKTQSPDEIIRHLKSYHVEPKDSERTLNDLMDNHLIDFEDEGYRLASQSMLPRIYQWTTQQTALVQARQEAMNQLKQMRNSALRGLVGGAIGFALFDQFMYTGLVPDIPFLVQFVATMTAIGGITGFLLTLTIDLSIAAYHGSRTWIRYLVGGAGGMIAFALGLILYSTSNYSGNLLMPFLPSLTIEGGLWGAAIGLGTTYLLGGNRKVWLVVPGIALVSGFIFLAAEQIFGGVVNEDWAETPSAFRILLAGVLMPLCYMTAALFRRFIQEKWR